MEPSPSLHYLEVFAALLSQHVGDDVIGRAAARLAVAHRWHKCVKAKVTLEDEFFF